MRRMLYRALFVSLLAIVAAGPAWAGYTVQLHPLTLDSGTPPHAPAAPLGALPLQLPALAMAIRIKDAGSLAKKFVQRASAAAPEYTDGVKAAAGDWEQRTKDSADNYAQGTQAAIADGRFAKGVSAAGAGKYLARASTLGAQRYPTGIAASEGEWAKGTQPYLQTLAGLTLPIRRPKGDPANMERANFVARALRAQRLGK